MERINSYELSSLVFYKGTKDNPDTTEFVDIKEIKDTTIYSSLGFKYHFTDMMNDYIAVCEPYIIDGYTDHTASIYKL